MLDAPLRCCLATFKLSLLPGRQCAINILLRRADGIAGGRALRPDRFRFLMCWVVAISREAGLLNASLSRALHQRVCMSIESAQNSSDMCDYSISCFRGLEMDQLTFFAK